MAQGNGSGGGGGGFNIPIGGLILDAIVMIVAIAGVAYWSYNTKGVKTIAAAQDEVRVTADEAQIEIDQERAQILEHRGEVELALSRRDSLERETRVVKAQIPENVQGIQDSRIRAQELTAENLTLRGRLGTQRDRLRDLRTQVEALDEQAADLAAQQSALEDSAMVNDQVRLALDQDVEEMVEYREKDPWSIFPVSASLAAYVEFADQANFLNFNLAKDFYRRGKFDFGIDGTLGFGDEQGTSLKEIGLYTNYELAFRRASVDLGLGYSGQQVGTSSKDDDVYVKAVLRYAPYYRERAFLLLGTKYSHESLSYHLGVGFGRR